MSVRPFEGKARRFAASGPRACALMPDTGSAWGENWSGRKVRTQVPGSACLDLGGVQGYVIATGTGYVVLRSASDQNRSDPNSTSDLRGHLASRFRTHPAPPC